MQVKYLSFDGVYFDNPEDCLKHEQENPRLKMWDEHGVTTSPDDAKVVWLSSSGGAEAFVEMCNKEGISFDGIDECSTGTFIWSDECFAWTPFEDKTMRAVRLYFEDTK
jgi:hypothetical protein